jgi:hypothetical protein
LHPDLQERLIRRLLKAIEGKEIIVIIATHGTAILGALNSAPAPRVGFITFGQNEIYFNAIDKTLQRILPIFGAHPLSNIFNKTPIFLVEGEDDERIWQQAVRSARGELKLWPCHAGDIQSLDECEDES